MILILFLFFEMYIYIIYIFPNAYTPSKYSQKVWELYVNVLRGRSRNTVYMFSIFDPNRKKSFLYNAVHYACRGFFSKEYFVEKIALYDWYKPCVVNETKLLKFPTHYCTDFSWSYIYVLDEFLQQNK